MNKSHAVSGLVTLEARTAQAPFLDYFGSSFESAVGRWPTLASFVEYRRRFDNRAYAGVDAWEAFYGLVDAGRVARTILISFVEYQ